MPSKVKLNLPKAIWTKADTMRLALDTLASIKLRTSKGLDASGGKFKEYSKKKIYISVNKGTGARLKPKGGTLTKTGKTMRFDGGYQEYKHLSRKRGTVPGQTDSAEVDLVLSGALMNNLVILKATKTHFVIGLTKHAKHYGYAVNEQREYLGLSPSEIRLLVVAARQTIADKLGK
jgi:hypothetical protein